MTNLKTENTKIDSNCKHIREIYRNNEHFVLRKNMRPSELVQS